MLIIFYIIVAASGGIYLFSFQKNEMDTLDSQLNKMRMNYSSAEELQKELDNVAQKVAVVDSVLFSGKFTAVLRFYR